MAWWITDVRGKCDYLNPEGPDPGGSVRGRGQHKAGFFGAVRRAKKLTLRDQLRVSSGYDEIPYLRGYPLALARQSGL